MKKTPNFHLSQWDSTDRIIMNDFNDDNKKVDAALAKLQAEKADRTTADDLQTQVNARATTSALNSAVSNLQSQLDGKIVVGTYQGDNQNTRFISLGFTPKMVFVIPNHAELVNTGRRRGGLALEGSPCQDSNRKVVEIVTGGFNVFYTGTSYTSDIMANYDGFTYHYFAVR